VYNQFLANAGNDTCALFNLDLPDSQTGAGLNVPGEQCFMESYEVHFPYSTARMNFRHERR